MKTESNNTDSKGMNSSSNRVPNPELRSSNSNSCTDTQTESWWQFLLSLEFDELTAFQQSHPQSDLTDFQFPSSDCTVTCYAELDA